MKLKLIAVAVAVSALSPLAHAQAQNPRPSFDDFAAPVGASAGSPEARRDFPKPSFADGPVVAEERAAPAYDARPVAEVLAAFPQPSSVAN
jgi:hypothetical protein